jgi:putative transposase
MPRIARVVVPDAPHHVTQRGNRREDIFFSDADRRVYLRLLWQYAYKNDVAVHAYCLMTNHVHLVVTPRRAESLAQMLKPVHLRYAQHVNWSQGLSGRLWQGRFYSCPLEGAHVEAAVRYVERNPVRAGMVEQAELHPWSTAGTHCGSSADPHLIPLDGFPSLGPEWRAWLREPEEEDTLRMLRVHTRTGRPLGSQTFVAFVESLLNRVVHPRKGGRPRKQTKHG